MLDLISALLYLICAIKQYQLLQEGPKPINIFLYTQIIKQLQQNGYIDYMTLNVPVNNEGLPLALPDQQFLLYRPDIEFQVKIDQLGKKSLKGNVFLTTFRIIFVSQKPSEELSSFDIPLFSLYGESVQMPIFGATYLKGDTPPYKNILPGHCHFKLWFNNGGSDSFIKNLSSMIQETRKHKVNQNINSMNQSPIANQIRNGTFSFNAFVDPNDPTKIYARQNN